MSTAVGDGGAIHAPEKRHKSKYKYKYKFIHSIWMEEIGANKWHLKTII